MENILITNREIGKFDQRTDGVYLSIYSATKENYDFEDLRKEIIRKGLVNANFDVIYKIWEKASEINE